MLFYILGSIGQWLAFCMMFAGIAIEIHYEADIGFVAITAGSILMGFITKIKEIGADNELQRMKRDEHRNRH